MTLAEFYKKEELASTVKRLDTDLVSQMEERYKQEEAELLSRKREVKSEAGDDQIKDEDLES